MGAILMITSLLLLCACAQARIFKPGKCPDPAVVQDFDGDRFQGVWYEYSSSLPILELGGKCPKLQYSLDPTTGEFVGVYTIMLHGKEHRLSAKATAVDSALKEGNYKATVDVINLYLIGYLDISLPYKLVGTDYDNFTVIYTCINFTNLVHATGVVVLTRQRQVDAEVQKKIDDVIEKAGVSDVRLSKSNQSNCNN